MAITETGAQTWKDLQEENKKKQAGRSLNIDQESFNNLLRESSSYRLRNARNYDVSENLTNRAFNIGFGESKYDTLNLLDSPENLQDSRANSQSTFNKIMAIYNEYIEFIDKERKDKK